jgi:hypothetical protein
VRKVWLRAGLDVVAQFACFIAGLALHLVESAADCICGVTPSAMYFALDLSSWMVVMNRSTALQCDLSILRSKLFDGSTRDLEEGRGIGLAEGKTLRFLPLSVRPVVVLD